jgi:hypothetical protein
MSRSQFCPPEPVARKKSGRILRALVVTVAFSATLLSTATVAQAAWGPPQDGLDATPQYEVYCGPYDGNLHPELQFQSCIIENVITGHAQSILAVSNTSGASRRVRGETHLWIDGVHTFTNCGDRTIGARTRQWCWGATKPAGALTALYAEGILYDYALGKQYLVQSPPV